MKYDVHGSVTQVVEFELESGEAVFSESGGMCWIQEGVKMDSNMRGGLLSGISRKFSGESIFMNTYRAERPGAKVAFASEFVGNVVVRQLAEGESVICQKDAFMVAAESCKLEAHFQKKLGAGLFGGEGFILQKVTGPGLAFFEIAGEVIEKQLGEGEVLKVNPGYIAMFDPTVKYDIERVKGVKNMLFGGEGLFLAKVTGPGKIWLQTITLPGLAAALKRYIIVPK
jgi:uncharacterized protein (TIGR00266 family)